MTKKKVDLNERLNRESRNVTAITKDPALPTQITVTLDQLVPFDNNPRQSDNPKYEEIKASIRERGLDHRFNVTRREPKGPYMIADGGNTRLQALRELWEETGDEKFYRHEVVFKPWVDDEHALAGHLVENDQRGEMKMIERALAAQSWIALIEKREGGTVSQRKACEIMNKAGWTSINSSNLSVLLYAATELLPHLPQLMWSGAGVGMIKKIRSYHNAYKAYWDALVEAGEEPIEPWENLWAETLQEFDDESFDFDGFFQQMNIRFGDAVDESFNAVGAEIFSILNGAKPSSSKAPNPIYGRDRLQPSTTGNDVNGTHSPGQSDDENQAKPRGSAPVTPHTPTVLSLPRDALSRPSAGKPHKEKTCADYQRAAYNAMSNILGIVGLDDRLRLPEEIDYPAGFGYYCTLPATQAEWAQYDDLTQLWLEYTWAPYVVMTQHAAIHTDPAPFQALEKILPWKFEQFCARPALGQAMLLAQAIRFQPQTDEERQIRKHLLEFDAAIAGICEITPDQSARAALFTKSNQ